MQKLSKYLLKTTCGEDTFLYNMLTRQSVAVNTNKIKKSISFSPLEKEQLKDNFFIVNSSKEDKKNYDNIRYSYLFSDNVVRFTIHLTYRCNLACYYCYQRNLRKDISISDETMLNVINFILIVIQNTTPEYIDICFIGGEPFLEFKKMLIIMAAMKEYKQKVVFNIVSNGILVTAGRINQLQELGKISFFITIDGSRNFHNKIRISQKYQNTYDLVMNNLNILKNKLFLKNVIINCNLTNDNYRDIAVFLEDLKNNNIDYPVYYSIVQNFNKLMDKKNSDSKKNVKNFWRIVHELSNTYGYKYDPFYREIYLGCSMRQKNNFNIGPDGILYSCIEGIGVSDFAQCCVSEYNSNLFIVQRSQHIINDERSQRCRSCSYIPVCDGGCQYKKYLNTFQCPKSSFDTNDKILVGNYISNLENTFKERYNGKR